MAASDYTSDMVLAAIRRHALLPRSTSEFMTDADILAITNEEIQTYIVDVLMSVHEEYLVFNKDTTLTSATAYPIPDRAIGRKLRDVLISSDGVTFAQLPRVEPEYRVSSGVDGYYFENDSVCLTSAMAGTLRMQYFIRPNKLVQTGYGTITSIAGTVANFAAVTPAFSTSTPVDAVAAKPGFRHLAIDQTPTAASSTAVTFTVLPTGLVVGDYVCLAGESPVPQVPPECIPLLVMRVVTRILAVLGDPKINVAKGLLDERYRSTVALLSPRDEGSSRYIVNRYGPGFSTPYRRRR